MSAQSPKKTARPPVDPEIEAITKVLAAMEPLTPEARDRVARWINAKLDMTSFGSSAKAPQRSFGPNSDGPPSSDASTVNDDMTFTPKVVLWMKQSALTRDDLAEVFHLAGADTSVLSSEMPGRNDRERSMNAYLLTGIAEFLKTGTPNFNDQTARALCSATGCYDATNHSRRIGGKELVGSKDRGWSLTGPGLKKAATIIKEMGSAKE